MTTEYFKKAILKELTKRAQTDPLFLNRFILETKNIDDCMKYILNTVEKSGRQGFADDEIFGMAMHYYQEDDIDVGNGMPNCKIIVNEEVKLSEEEIKELREMARKKIIEEEMEKLRPKKKKTETPKQETDTNTLF